MVSEMQQKVKTSNDIEDKDVARTVDYNSILLDVRKLEDQVQNLQSQLAKCQTSYEDEKKVNECCKPISREMAVFSLQLGFFKKV